MVRILATVFSALALSGAVLAAPSMKMDPEPAMAEPAMAMSMSASAMMGEATSTSSAMMNEMTSSAKKMKAESTTMMKEGAMTTSAMAAEATTTSAAMAYGGTSAAAAAPAATTSAMYGSGAANWGTDLNSCVQMCQAKFGMGSGSAAPPASTTVAAAAGTGATHTVIVAPTKGVLRYVPFAVNASVGDTVRFMWGAGPHTVTKSAALTVCNKSADASTFASGQQNASFVFDQVVNNTDPTFFYCAVPTHCQKGMFGIINPPSAPAGAATSVGMMMSTWTSQSADLGKMQTAVDAMTINTPAYNWASNMDASAVPVEAQLSLAENIFYTRMFYAANTGAEGSAARPDGQPLSIPSDVNTLLTGTAANPAGASGAPAGSVAAGTPTGSAAAASTTPTANSASGLMASSALIALVAVVSSLFLI